MNYTIRKGFTVPQFKKSGRIKEITRHSIHIHLVQMNVDQ